MSFLINPHRFPPPGPFSPASLSGLAQWYDPSDTETLTMNNTTVAQMDDKSGNGDHATQATSAAQPSLGNINGVTALSFSTSGTEDEMVLPDPDGITGSQNRSLFVVFENEDLDANQSLVSYGSPGGEGSFHLASRTTNKIRLGIWPSLYDANSLSPGTAPHQAGVILEGTAGNDCTLYLDGLSEQVVGVPATIATNPSGEARIGSVHGVESMDGLIGEIILYNRALSAAERQKVEGYLAHKWGLEANLPSGHPYKSAAP